MNSPLHLPSALLGALILSACSRYSVSVNERVVYTPPPLFQSYVIADEHLRACVKANIQEAAVVEAAQLKTLLCSAGNIKSLSGLEVFSNLRKLGLAHNAVGNLETLASLPELKHLNLSHNAVNSVTPLLALERLSTVNLAENPELDCETVSTLRHPGRDIVAPQCD